MHSDDVFISNFSMASNTRWATDVLPSAGEYEPPAGNEFDFEACEWALRLMPYRIYGVALMGSHGGVWVWRPELAPPQASHGTARPRLAHSVIAKLGSYLLVTYSMSQGVGATVLAIIHCTVVPGPVGLYMRTSMLQVFPLVILIVV